MNYGEIKKTDIANGEGVRVSLFVSGCRHHCRNCFNPETWSFDHGKKFDTETEREIFEALDKSFINGLTVLGGEPFEPENQEVLAPFLKRVRSMFPNKTIWCYSGCTFEMLTAAFNKYHGPYTDEILSCLDVLVDGPFVDSLKDITLRFRGSSNQRIIDINKTFATGEVVLWG